MPEPLPTVQLQLTLQLDRSLARSLAANESIRGPVRWSIEQGLTEVLDVLGIPSQPRLEIEPLTDPLPHETFMRVSVNGARCRFPDELPGRVLNYVNGRTLDTEAKPSHILGQLTAFAEESSSTSERLIEFLGLVCAEVVKRRPAVLFGPAQADAYSAALPAPRKSSSGPWPPDPAWLRSVVSQVLNLKISIANRQAVANTLAAAGDNTAQEIAEELIVALRPAVIDVRLPPDHLHQITTSKLPLHPDLFASLREGLFQELGVRYPPFHFAPAPTLKANSFAFTINHLPTLPWIGLRADRCLVNDTLSRLRLLNLAAEAAGNPATGLPASIIDLGAKSQAESAGLTTWDQAGYFILCFAASLREHAALFLDSRVAHEQLREFLFPALAKASQSTISVAQLTHVLRELATEGIPLRNFRLILERLLDYDESDALTAFVRAGLKRQISHKHTRGTGTLVVYLLDPKIEEILARADVTEAEHDRIVEAIKAEADHLPPTAMMPALLTSGEARPRLSEVLSAELPRIAAVSYEELPAGLNIQPVARIALLQ